MKRRSKPPVTELSIGAGTSYAAAQHLLDRANLVFQRWLDARADGEEVVSAHHEREASSLPDPADLSITVHGGYGAQHGERGLIGEDADGRSICLTYSASSQWLTVRVVTRQGIGDAKAAIHRVLEATPVPKRLPNDRSRFVFWTLTPNGPTNSVRDLRVPAWDQTYAINYARSAVTELEHLHDFVPTDHSAESGKLILLHGPPGTGKTTAIRSLARSWRTWCRVDYVVDPDEFFDHAYYMANVLLHDAGNFWRLIVIEDADELIAPDAKLRSGQALSRLLNLCDGLVGQGLKVLVLLTTNAELPRLHEAVIRPGRCLYDLHLPKLSAYEAREWALAHDVDLPFPLGDVGATLAQLYQLKQKTHERAPIPTEPQPGYV